MSETATVRPAPKPPVEFLLNLLVTLLTPMFLAATGDNLALARFAAAQTLESYRAETHSDLITIAKIIGFGLAALGSLSLSMAEDLPTALVLRLRASANACDRAEHRNRLALEKARLQHPAPPFNPEPDIDEAALAAAVAETRQRTAENLARFKAPAPSVSTAAPTASTATAEAPSTPTATAAAPATPTAPTAAPTTPASAAEAPSTPTATTSAPSTPTAPTAAPTVEAPTVEAPTASTTTAEAPSTPAATTATRTAKAPTTPITDRDQHYQATWAACTAEIAA